MKLSTRRWGNEDDRRALLLHGISSSAAGWWRLGPDLAALGYEVIAPDLRGHGGTGPADSYLLADYAADISELGDRWDLVLGHSLGGTLALLLVQEQGDWTDRLVLEDPGLFILDPEETVRVLNDVYQSPITTEALLEASPTWHREDARIKAEALRLSSPEVVERTFLDNPRWNFVRTVVELSIPTLLVGAAPGQTTVPRELGESVVELNPAVEFVVIPNASHSIHRDEYQALLQVVAAFVA